MPFDATPATDPTVVYRARRERACALWESLPRERFDLRCYGSGSTACALGWLARARIDGWEWRHGWLPPRPVWRGGAPKGGSYQHAAEYFGLTLEQARACFGNGPGTARTHRRGDAAEVTGADVAATPRALPVCTGPEGGRQRLVTIGGLGETCPTGNRSGDAVGHACLGVGGPVTRTATVETGRGGRVARMRQFGARLLSLLPECREVARPKP